MFGFFRLCSIKRLSAAWRPSVEVPRAGLQSRLLAQVLQYLQQLQKEISGEASSFDGP
jgi:hypothetical protein